MNLFQYGFLRSIFVATSILCFLSIKPVISADEPGLPANGGFSEAIEDNSIIIEEAYNQEDRIVQHISNFNYGVKPGDFEYVFTQEWPLFGLNHQFSYELSYQSLAKGLITGFGDIQLNYRYQLTYKDSWAVMSPRLSVIIPTGNKDKGLGNGSFGIEANIPVSKRWTDWFVTHVNVGANMFPSVKDESVNFEGSITNYWAGISGILLLSQNFNLMLECLNEFNAVPQAGNRVEYTNDLILAPAVRCAVDLGDLQIVPAISVPVRFSSQTPVVYADAYFYLSFEHPF